MRAQETLYKSLAKRALSASQTPMVPSALPDAMSRSAGEIATARMWSR